MRKINYTDYVCDKCFYQLPDCKCYKFIAPTLIEVDEKIQYAVRVLNQKGWKTRYSCEGHFDEDDQVGQIYIAFDKDVKLPSAPEGWHIELGPLLLDIECRCGKGLKETEKTQEQFNEEKEKALKHLNYWVDNLEINQETT